MFYHLCQKGIILSYLDRRDEFLKLENSIREVYELFMELASMVEQQGESINNIVLLVEGAEARVYEGVKELKQAEQYQTSARKKKLIIAAILVAIIIIVIVIVATN